MKRFIRKDEEAVSPVIAVILMVAITVVLAGVLYVWVSSFGGGGTTGVSISASLDDKTSYYSVGIIKVSGGSLSLDDAKFRMVSKAGIQQFTVGKADAIAAAPLESGQSDAYPVQSGTQTIIQNTSAGGDGNAITTDEADSLNKPQTWQYCSLCYLDANGDGKVNAGDKIWVYKDFERDGTANVEPGYNLKILDGKDNEVLTKEF